MRAVTSRPRATAAVLLATTAVLAVGGFGGDAYLVHIGRGDLRQFGPSAIPLVAGAAVSAIVGASLVVRRPEHPVGYLFALLAIFMFGGGAFEAYGVAGMLARPRHPWPAAYAVATLSDVMFVVWLVLLGLICHLTPDGRPLSPRWRRAAVALPIVATLWMVDGAISMRWMNPPFEKYRSLWAVPSVGATTNAVEHVGVAVTMLLVLTGSASLVVRFGRSSGDDRRRLLWFVAIAAIPLPVFVASAAVASTTHHEGVVNIAAGGFVCSLPIAAWLSITRYHLYDVERVLNRAVTYLLASLLLATTYAVVVLAAGRFVSGGDTAPVPVALATLAAAALARPAYHAVQDAVDRRFARRRYDALRVVRDFLAAPDATRSVEDVLRQALRDDSLHIAYWLPEAQSWVTGDGLATCPPADALLIQRAGRDVARVDVTTTDFDDTTLRAVLEQAAGELDNMRLRAAVSRQLEEVRASRARIAAAQLDERRRIERDLHDGAQQRLLALAAQLQAARLNGDEKRMRAALDDGTMQAREAVLELRRLANGLHPSVLTDGGLGAAFDELAARMPIRVEVSDCRRHSPVVEATAWFVACEAVANAMKHTGGDDVELTLSNGNGNLTVRVTDHGQGGANPNGHGLRGLTDRVEAIGGRLTVTSSADGTAVEAVLPCG